MVLKPTAKVQGDQMYNRIKNVLGATSGAFDYMDKAGLRDYLKTPRTALELEQWLGSVAPKVEVRKFGEHKMARDPNYEFNGVQGTRKDLIFLNPDGTPKTSVTGRAYSIDKLDPSKFTMFGKDRPVQTVDKTSGKMTGESGSIIDPKQALENLKTGAEEEKTFGLAARVSKARATQGQIEEPEEGDAANREDILARGKELLAQGVDPHKVIEQAVKTKMTSTDTFAVAWAHGESLLRKANEAADKHGVDSSEYKAAAKADSDWIAMVKKAQTLWGEQGRAQQGEVEIDTGTYHGMARAYFEDTGKEFTDAQAKHVKELTDKVKAADQTIAEKQAQLQAALKAFAEEAARPKVATKTGAEILADAAKYGFKGSAKALQGLHTLFGGGSGNLGSLGSFDEKTWAAAKPLFEEAWQDLKQSGKSLGEFAQFALDKWGQNVEPYITKFVADNQGEMPKEKPIVDDWEVGIKPIRKKVVKSRGDEQSAAVWEYLKQVYLDKGETDFDTIRHGVATDLGLPVEDVTKILSRPKGISKVTDEMYAAMDQRRKLRQSAEFWLQNQKVPGWARFFVGTVPRVFFLDKIFGHGTVGMITHAGINVFDANAWKTYFPSFLRQYKLAYSKTHHEQWIADQTRKPRFTMWKRAGLKCDPYKYPDDYQNAAIKGFMGKLGVLVGNYGFDALKDFRINRANQLWNQLPAELRFKDGKVNREMAGMIADQVNHATGIVHMPFREWSSLAFFAPRLEASRWAWMIGDPAKAANTFKGWKNASAEDRAFATAEVKQKATVVGVYLGLLGINQAMLSMTGSEDKVNLTNPRKGDWLAFKVAGHNVGIAGPMLGMVRLFVNLIHDSVGDRSKFESLRDRGSEMGATVLQYGRGKLSPMAGFGMDIATQETAMKDVVPWSEDKPEKGKKTLSGGEYGMETFLPIPFEEAVKEVWTDQGMSAEQQNLWLNLLKGAAVVIGAGGTGARISSEAKPAEPAPEKNPFPIRGIPKFKKYSQGDIINRNNKNYTVTGFDTDGEPLVEEV